MPLNTNFMTTTNSHSTSEVGHAKNVANFQDLIAFCESYGTDYNPVNPIISIPKLQTLRQKAEDAIQAVHATKATFMIATNERQQEFQKLEPLATRILNALAVATADTRIVNDVRTLVKKIRGEASKPKTDEAQPGQEVQRTVSNSQQSYDKLVDHFAAIIEILKQVPAYAPNETELGLSGLELYLSELKKKNTDIVNTYTPYSNVLMQRNYTLYDKLVGLVPVAKLVKSYVKSLFGASSPQYRQVGAIEFRKY